MKKIGAFEAKTHLSEILEEVKNGEKVTVTKRGKQVEEFFEALEEEQEVLAPSIWWYELGNVVSNAVKTNRIEANDAAEIFELWEQLPITNDHQQNTYTIHNIYKLSKKTGLTVYD